MTLIFAHRGFFRIVSEKYDDGFIEAEKEQADGIELDVHLAKMVNRWLFMMKEWIGRRTEQVM